MAAVFQGVTWRLWCKENGKEGRTYEVSEEAVRGWLKLYYPGEVKAKLTEMWQGSAVETCGHQYWIEKEQGGER